MTIYADILFLVNLSLNWFSLILTSKIMKLKSSTVKLLSASAAGALAGTISVIFSHVVLVAALEIASTFLMCAIAFKAFSIWGYIKICTCLFASGVTLGGSLTFIYSMFNNSNINIPSHNDISSAVFILLSFAVTLVALVFERIIISHKTVLHGELVIEYNGKRLDTEFFCDSGNFLCDPISGKPAIIIEEDMLHGLLPKTVFDLNPLYNQTGTTNDIHKRIRLLPAKTVCSDSIMLGFIPDRIIIVTNNDKKIVDAIIAIEKRRPASALRAKAIVPACLV